MKVESESLTRAHVNKKLALEEEYDEDVCSVPRFRAPWRRGKGTLITSEKFLHVVKVESTSEKFLHVVKVESSAVLPFPPVSRILKKQLHFKFA